MTSSFHSLIPFLPSLFNRLRLSSQETPLILSQPALEPRGGSNRKHGFSNNSSIVIEMRLPRRCIETAVFLLLRACSFPQERV
jgi:hypothetical protein